MPNLFKTIFQIAKMNLNKLKTVSKCWCRLNMLKTQGEPANLSCSVRSISYFLPKEYLINTNMKNIALYQSVKSRPNSTDSKHEKRSNVSEELSPDLSVGTYSLKLSSMETVFQRFYEEVEFRSQLRTKLNKIDIEHKGHDKNLTVRVNRNFSTPLDVARHLGQNYVRLSAAAKLENGRLLDMNQPISESGKKITMEFMWFKNHKGQDPTVANNTLWNTMPLVSASLLDTMFKDTILVSHRSPSVNLSAESGVFGYEFELVSTEGSDKQYQWRASEEELVLINRKLQRFLNSRPQIYGLDVNLSTCERLFGEDCSFKVELARELMKSPAFSGNQLRLYSCGAALVDIHPGCLLPSTHLIGQALITSVYPLKDIGESGGTVHRIEGVALPTVLPAHHSAWSVIVDAAKQDSRQREQDSSDENHGAVSIQQFVNWYIDQQNFRNNLQNNLQIADS